MTTHLNQWLFVLSIPNLNSNEIELDQGTWTWTFTVSFRECRPSVLTDVIHVQGCLKDSKVLKVNIALVCLLCCFGIKTEEVILG